MTYDVEFTEDAERHLASFNKRDRVILLDSIKEHLVRDPTIETRRRKLLRDNPLASWELRVGEYRAFYNVDIEPGIVTIVAIGLKSHNALIIDGKEFSL